MGIFLGLIVSSRSKLCFYYSGDAKYLLLSRLYQQLLLIIIGYSSYDDLFKHFAPFVPSYLFALQTKSIFQGLNEIPPRLNVPQRMASLIRFREKRKERNFDKKIRYTVRKEVALRYETHDC